TPLQGGHDSMSGTSRGSGRRRGRWDQVRLPKTPPPPQAAPSPQKKRQRLAWVLVGLTALLPAGLLVAWLSAGWGSLPRAPALIDEPVYRNAHEGFRFLVPEGWTVHSKGEPPPGRADKERLLVNYQRYGGDKPAQFEVTL